MCTASGAPAAPGRLGTSISIAVPSDDKYLAAIEQLLKSSLPRVEAPVGFAGGDAPARDDRKAEGNATEDRKGGSRERGRRRRRDEPRPEAEAAAPPAPVATAAEPEARMEPKAQPEPRPEPEARAEQPRREMRTEDAARIVVPTAAATAGWSRQDAERCAIGSQGDGHGRSHPPVHAGRALRQRRRDRTTRPTETVAEAPAADPAPKPARRSRGRGRGKAQAETATEAPVEAQPEALQPETVPADAVQDAQPVAEAPVQAEAPAVEPAAEPKPKRTRGRKKAETAETDAPAVEPVEETAPKPKRTRSRRPATDEAEAPAEAAVDAPKPTRRRRPATADAPAADAATDAPENRPPQEGRRRRAAQDADAGLMRGTPRPLSRLRGGRPPLRSLLPDLALGLIAALGLAPLGIWAATPLAMAALIWRLSPLPAAAVFWHVLAAGFGWFALSLSWITEPFLVDIARHGWMAPFALILMALGGALFWAVPAGAAARLARGPAAQATAIAAALVCPTGCAAGSSPAFPGPRSAMHGSTRPSPRWPRGPGPWALAR